MGKSSQPAPILWPIDSKTEKKRLCQIQRSKVPLDHKNHKDMKKTEAIGRRGHLREIRSERLQTRKQIRGLQV